MRCSRRATCGGRQTGGDPVQWPGPCPTRGCQGLHGTRAARDRESEFAEFPGLTTRGRPRVAQVRTGQWPPFPAGPQRRPTGQMSCPTGEIGEIGWGRHARDHPLARCRSTRRAQRDFTGRAKAHLQLFPGPSMAASSTTLSLTTALRQLIHGHRAPDCRNPSLGSYCLQSSRVCPKAQVAVGRVLFTQRGSILFNSLSGESNQS